jgi:hypothetical protein
MSSTTTPAKDSPLSDPPHRQPATAIPVPADEPAPLTQWSGGKGNDVQAMFLTREQLRSRTVRTLNVDIPDDLGGGRVKLRALKQVERERLDDEALEKTYHEDGNVTVKLNNRGFQAKALAMCMVNPDLSAYYPTVEEGMQELGEMDDKLFDVLFAGCDTLNILTANARKALGKDSAPTPSSSSSSTSPMSGVASSKS